MHWKELEKIIQENDSRLTKAEVERLSTELLESLGEDTQPLQAARMAYALSLIQLKAKKIHQDKILKFVDHLRHILKHEIQMTETSNSEEAETQLLVIRKLAEHYFHHLLVLAQVRSASKVTKKLSALRKSNHAKLLKLKNGMGLFWRREQQLLRKSVRKHYLFAGFLFSIALYFSWTTFWGITDFLLAQWVYSEYSTETVATLVQQGLLLLFSVSFVWAFVKYQSGGEVVTEES